MSTTITPQAALTQIITLAQEGLAYTPPPPPTPPIDVASWWYPKPGKFVKPCFVRQLADSRLAMYFAKTAEGWPMDIQLADGEGVYFRLTDTGTPIGWPGSPGSSPANFRLYPQPNPGAPSLGFKISLRYYDPAQGRVQVSSVADVPTQWWTGCSVSSTNPKVTHLGPAASFISLVKQHAFTGDLGVQDTLICEYYYTALVGPPNGFKTREQFYLTEESGWGWWDVANWNVTQKQYVIANSSYPDKFVPDTLQVPVMPCGVSL